MPNDRPQIFLTCDSKHTYIFLSPDDDGDDDDDDDGDDGDDDDAHFVLDHQA